MLILPQNWCLIFFRDPAAEFTTERLKQALLADGLPVLTDVEPYEVRYPDCPPLRVSLHRGPTIETIVRGLVGRGRKHRDLIPGLDTQITVEADDLAATLDEINTLIVTQEALRTATQGLMYLSWNRAFVGPGD